MAFQEIRYFQPLRDFLTQYPHLHDGETLELDYIKITGKRGDATGDALVPAGTSIVKRAEDVQGNVFITEQVNLILKMCRHTEEPEFCLALADFLLNFNRWVNYEDSMRGTSEEHPLLPHFSMTQNETIRADGGMLGVIDVEPGVDEFRIQIHLQYDTIYVMPDQ
jgi:hypothetical protein